MMTVLSLFVYAAAMMAVMGVMATTLWPALPRIVALLTGAEHAYATPVVRRADRRRVVRVSAMQAAPAWRAAA